MNKMQRQLKKLFFFIFVGYPLLLLSFITPRNKNKWVMGSKNGFTCNAKYFFIEFMSRDMHPQQLIWLTRHRSVIASMQSIGFKNVYYLWSLKGFYHLLTSGTYITTHEVDETLLYWTMGRAKYANLWHGIGIKNLKFKSYMPASNKLFHGKYSKYLYYPYALPLHKKPDLFVSTSPLMTEHFCECFRIKPQNCIEAIYPRCAPFSWTEAQRSNFIERYEPEQTQTLIKRLQSANLSYIYMPTWRNNDPYFFDSIGFDFQALNQFLVLYNRLFILKLHPYTPLESLKGLANCNHIILLTSDVDVYTLLPYTNVLITDYSSIYYDYILMPEKHSLLFPFDYEQYIGNNKDLAFDYHTHTPGHKVYSFTELMNALANDQFTANRDLYTIRDLFWAPAARNVDIIESIKKL